MARLLPLCLLAALLVACTGENPGEEEPVAGQAARFGLISITYGHDWNESGEGMMLTSAAQFVRYSAMARDQVARLLALPLDPDRDLPAVDRCKVYDLSVDLPADMAVEPESGSVELLEAGDLQVQTPGRSVKLAPKHFPGLLPFISGVVYSEAEATLVEQAGKVSATSTGGEAVGPFTAQAASPTLPRLLEVGSAAPSGRITLARDRDLAVRWSLAEGTAEQAADLVYLELRFARGKKDVALRCRPRDDGSFEIPQAMLAEVTGHAVLELARLRRSLFTANGLDQGELRVTVRDSATIE